MVRRHQSECLLLALLRPFRPSARSIGHPRRPSPAQIAAEATGRAERCASACKPPMHFAGQAEKAPKAHRRGVAAQAGRRKAKPAEG
jgi:hypothetical protein